jgi:D-xylose transport system substrate-binding protein
MNTKTLTRLCILFLLIIVTSCSNQSKYKVGFVLPSNDFPRFNIEGKYMAERCKQLGIEMTIVNGENDETVQFNKGMELINDGVDLLVITAINGGTIAPLVREAKSKGIQVIAYNRLISNAEYDLFFTGDNIDNAKIFCDYALKMKPRGKYVILAGDRFDRNGVELRQGIDSILKPKIASGDIKIIYESYIENWAKENSKFELEQVLQAYGTDIDVVISCSDPMGSGSIEALKKYSLEGTVIVTGQDAELEAVRNIYNGYQHITIYHPHKVLGYKAAELINELLKGKDGEDLANAKTFNGLTEIPTYQVKSVAVTKDNINKELVETGEYTWDQIRK